MKAIIWKSEEGTRYALPDSHVKADQESNLVIINFKRVKNLGLKIRLISTFTNHRLSMSIENRDSIELQS